MSLRMLAQQRYMTYWYAAEGVTLYLIPSDDARQ